MEGFKTHQGCWFSEWAVHVKRMLLCSFKQALKQWISELTDFKQNIIFLRLTFNSHLFFFSTLAFWSYSLCASLLVFNFFNAFEAEPCWPPPRRKEELQSTLVSSVTYSAHAPPPLLAFVTLMHWLGNICGMLIPRFQRRCRITTYCLSSRVSQLVRWVGWWVAWFPHRKPGRVDELAFKMLKAPCGTRGLRVPAGFCPPEDWLYFSIEIHYEAFGWLLTAVSTLKHAVQWSPSTRTQP